MESNVRVRFAPSPTGPLHIGGVRTALFNYLFAKKHGGTFVLRIEDTDQTRYVANAEQYIIDALDWCNIPFDEGPGRNEKFGPYRQSERKDLYKKYANILLEKGWAYYAFDTSEQLDAERKNHEEKGKTFIYNWHNREKGRLVNSLVLTDEEVQKRIENGDKYVVRFKSPQDETLVMQDEIRGEIKIDTNILDDKILFKSDGMPTYHLANIVDDHLMEISHVIRGEEWLSSAPKHQLLYKYFGWDMPELCHMPLLRNPDKSKLSKRKNPTSIMYYKRMGFMPEAVLNFLGRMGWSMPDEREKFSRQDMFDNFDIKRVSLGGPIFDQEKLSWLNSQWIRELSEEEFVQKFVEWGLDKQQLMPAVQHIQPRIERFTDVAPLAGFLLSGMPAVTAESFEHKKIEPEDMVKLLQMGLWQLESIRIWKKAEIQQRLFALAKVQDVKIKDFLSAFFVAIAGSTNSFSVLDSMEILGPDMSRARVRQAVDVLGGVSKKGMKKLEKEYRAVSQSIDAILAESKEG